MTGLFGAVRPSRFEIGRVLFTLLIVITLSAGTAGQAFAIESLRKYAGIVVDAKSGEVLYEKNADAKRYPASISKVMTLYILFQELDAGTIRLSDRMTVSPHAAAAVPTKLGLKAGWTITVEDAMKSLVTLSANDMARVVAEHISGSEAEFAKRMTATARALGMTRTTYRNASGLPDAEQITTARDQAKLGIAVYQHFPKHYELFQTDSFTYNGRTYGNHNRLLGANGVDGIKTGYIKASGSNLLTAARQNGRHIVVAAIGFNSASARDSRVRELVKTHLPKGRKGDYTKTAMIPEPGRMGTLRVAVAQPVTPKPYPAFRQARVQLASAASAITAAGIDASAASRDHRIEPALVAANMMAGSTTSNRLPILPDDDAAAGIVGAWVGETYSLSANPVAPTPEAATAVAAIAPIAPIAPIAAPTPAARRPDARASRGWVVQIGATPSREGATSLLDAAADQVSRLQDLEPYVERFEKSGQVFYRARFAGFDASEDATAVCKLLLQTKMQCLALRS